MKKLKNRKTVRAANRARVPSLSWIDDEGIHVLAPGGAKDPSPQELEELSKKIQDEVRNSPLWDEMVKQVGKEKAEELLTQVRASVK